MFENIKAIKKIPLTPKNEEYLESTLNNLSIKDKKKKKDYFHIGLKEITNEINYDYLVLVVPKQKLHKDEFLIKATAGSIINNNKTLFFTFDQSKEKIVEDIIKEEKAYNSCSDLLIINDYLLTFNEVFNYILEKDQEGNGVDVVFIDSIDYILINESKEKINYIYNMFFLLATTLRIHFMITISSEQYSAFNKDCYSCFDKIIYLSDFDDEDTQLTFLKKEKDNFIEYLDIIMEI